MEITEHAGAEDLLSGNAEAQMNFLLQGDIVVGPVALPVADSSAHNYEQRRFAADEICQVITDLLVRDADGQMRALDVERQRITVLQEKNTAAILRASQPGQAAPVFRSQFADQRLALIAEEKGRWLLQLQAKQDAISAQLPNLDAIQQNLGRFLTGLGDPVLSLTTETDPESLAAGRLATIALVQKTETAGGKEADVFCLLAVRRGGSIRQIERRLVSGENGDQESGKYVVR